MQQNVVSSPIMTSVRRASSKTVPHFDPVPDILLYPAKPCYQYIQQLTCPAKSPMLKVTQKSWENIESPQRSGFGHRPFGTLFRRRAAMHRR